MDRVKEIESAIEALPPDEYARLAEWFLEREQSRWDEQMDRDAVSGKLDFLVEEACRIGSGSSSLIDRSHHPH